MLTRLIVFGGLLAAAYFALLYEPAFRVTSPMVGKPGDPVAERIVGRIGISPDDSFHDRTDKIRRFVHHSSVHRIDEDLYEYIHDGDRILNMLEASFLGEQERPHLECWTRSNAMIRLAYAAGVRARKVIVYRPIDEYLSHTLLEVYNPDTKAWEMQDPDYDMFYVNADRSGRASIRDLITRPFDAFMPCSDAGTCGWDISSNEQHDPKALYDYFGLATYPDGETAVVLVNDDRFPFDDTFLLENRRIPFCGIKPALCTDGRIVRGSWGAR